MPLPSLSATVKAQITGQLTQVEFTEGQSVKPGDLLAVVDPRPYVVALQQAQGTLDKDQALLKNAQIDVQRYKTLVAQDSIPRQQLDTQGALAQQLQGTVDADQAQIDMAQVQLSYCSIRSPIDGRVGARLVDAGNIVHASDANSAVVVITQLDPAAVAGQ